MKLKCKINGTEYDIVNGATFSEEYNETLDSGSIILTGVPRLTDLRQFDDVFIYNSNATFYGYKSRKYCYTEIHTTAYATEDITQKEITIDGEELRDIFDNGFVEQDIQLQCYDDGVLNNYNFEIISLGNDNFAIKKVGENTQYTLRNDPDGNYAFEYYRNYGYDVANFEFFTFKSVQSNVTMPSFYRHLLIDTFTEERLNPIENLFKYKISLFSETKKLERIPLPNISITQPLNIAKRKSVAEYIRQYVSQYSPTIKVATSSDTWKYVSKYEIDDSIDTIFSNVYSPNFSLDNPSLRDLLNQLFLVKDRIPYVKDDVIYALDITQRNGIFNFTNTTNVTGSRTSENYSTGLKRTYNNALSSRRTVKNVEYLGFRNSDYALMTLDNMRLETKFPIYKINKIYMCYYKKAQIWSLDNQQYTGQDKVFLCKQDITKLVKLKEEQATLSKDWNDFTNNPPSTIDEMAQYRLCTVDYEIGNNIIDGWGTQYSYPKGWWADQTETKTYIENIFYILDKFYPYGIYTVGYLSRELGDNKFITIDQTVSNRMDNVVTPLSNSEVAKKLKTFFFIIDYEGFYNGTVITSKDDEYRDDIETNDNQGNSLTLLEKDGLFQKEKANRFGNMAYTYNAVYDNVLQVQQLGSVDNTLDDDVIIYHRSYAIYDTHVLAEYYGSKDYVLKNYFTSVYARHRPFNLLSYNQSVKRAENRKNYLLLSRTKVYYEKINSDYNSNPPMFFNEFTNYLSKLLTFCKSSEIPTSIDRFTNSEKINYGYVAYNTYDYYTSDIMTFVSGYSLCFNLSMWDNISMGNYIKTLSPDMASGTPENDLTGSVQSYYPVIDDVETGFTETLGFYVSHIPENEFKDTVFDYTASIGSTLYNKLLRLPRVLPLKETNIIGKEYTINKDNKEVIDMTFQIEALTDNCIFSEWMLKLSDLYGGYNKWDKNTTVRDSSGYLATYEVTCGTCFNRSYQGAYPRYYPFMVIKVPVSDFNNFLENQSASFEYAWEVSHYLFNEHLPFDQVLVGIDVIFTSIASIDGDNITFNAKTVEFYKDGWFGGVYQNPPTDTTITLTKISRIASINLDGANVTYYYLSNVVMTNDNNYPFMPIPNSINVNGHYGDTHDYITGETTEFTGLNRAIVGCKIGAVGDVTKTYFKNMFIKTNTTTINKTLVYNEYAESDFTKENFVVTDIIKVLEEERGKTKIRVDLSSINSNVNSLEMWYCEREDDSQINTGTMHFVFGVNITSEDRTNGYIDIYASMFNKKDTRVFSNTNNNIGEIKNYIDKNDYGDFQKYVLK